MHRPGRRLLTGTHLGRLKRFRFPGATVSEDPVARGALVVLPPEADDPLPALAKEAASILRALHAPAEVSIQDADYVVLLLAPGADPRTAGLPELKDRAASAIAVASDAGEGRVAVALARKHLRSCGAVLGARELVFSPKQFGYLGLESDGARERLEILLRALVLDAERLRLKREGWEEPATRDPL